jgi:hypothetical protein
MSIERVRGALPRPRLLFLQREKAWIRLKLRNGCLMPKMMNDGNDRIAKRIAIRMAVFNGHSDVDVPR